MSEDYQAEAEGLFQRNTQDSIRVSLGPFFVKHESGSTEVGFHSLREPRRSRSHHLWSIENRIVGVANYINQSYCSTLGIVIGWFFRFWFILRHRQSRIGDTSGCTASYFCFLLRQFSFQWSISGGFVSGTRRRKSNSDSSDGDSVELMIRFFYFHSVVSVLMTPTTTPALEKTNVETFNYNLQDYGDASWCSPSGSSSFLHGTIWGRLAPRRVYGKRLQTQYQVLPMYLRPVSTTSGSIAFPLLALLHSWVLSFLVF